MSTKKVNGALIGDHEVIGSVDNVWIDTSNPNKILTKVFVNGAWKTIADSAAASEAIAAVEAELTNKTNKVSEATEGNLAALDSSGDLTDSGKSTSDFMSAATNTGSDGQILEFTSSGPQWANAPEGTVVVDSAMSDSSTNAVQNKVIKAYVDAVDAAKADKTTLDNYALKTGSYDTLTAGMAKNIEGQSTSTGTFLERTTANALDVANGAASVKSVKGHSVVWNQLILNGNFAETPSSSNGWTIPMNGTVDNSNDDYITFSRLDTAGNFVYKKDKLVVGHKYYRYIRFRWHDITVGSRPYVFWGSFDQGYTSSANSDGSWTVYEKIGIADADGTTPQGGIVRLTCGVIDVDKTQGIQCIDLTRIFGAGNEPTTVAKFKSRLEQNVGLKPYYAYNAGSILNNKMTGIKTLGRNLLNPIAKTARLISYSYSDNSNKFCIKDLPSGATLSFTPDATGVSASVTPDANGVFTISGTGTLTVTTDSSLADTYLCYVWDGTMNDESEAYNVHTYPLDVTKIYGQLNGAGDLTQVYPNGMLSAVSVKDVLTKDSAVVNVGSVDLGTKSWEIPAGKTNLFKCTISGKAQVLGAGDSNLVCSTYVVSPRLSTNEADAADNVICEIKSAAASDKIFLADSGHDTAPTSEDNWVDGVILNYVLETPLVYTNLIYRDNGVDTPFSLPNILVDNWSTEQAEVTAYSSNSPTSCASTLELLYGVDVANFIDSANNGTFISEDSMDAFLSALGTAMGGTWSKSWDSTNGKWGFTFTPSSNFLAAGVEASGTWGVDETTNALTLTPDED